MGEQMGRKITRRGLFQSAGILGGLDALAGSTSGLGREAFAQAAGSTAQSGIEPNTIKRRGVGFRGYDSDRASPGFTLFAPLIANNKTVYLIDIRGNLVHTWEVPYPPGLYGYLTDHGTLFYNGKIPSSTHVGQAPYAGGAALEVDWKGRVLWEVRHPDHNHDGRRLRNGNVILICARPLPDEIARRVRGGRPGSEYDGSKMDAPYPVEMTTAGEIVWEWRSWDHLDPEKDGITAIQDDRDVWTVANAVYELPDGNIMVSFRAISTGCDDQSSDRRNLLETRCSSSVRSARAKYPGKRSPLAVRQWTAPAGRDIALLARTRNRCAHKKDRVEIPG
jgi:hypothetical protein